MYNNTELENISNHYSEIKNIDFSKTTSSPDLTENRIIDSDLIRLDFNKNLIDDNTLPLLEKFLISKNFYQFRKNLFSGGIINTAENKSADHIVLRNSDNDIFQGSQNVKDETIKALNKINEITQMVHSGKSSQYITGNIKHVVHIGIGGSDLGPRLVVDALEEYKFNGAPEILFLSSVDPYEIRRILNKIDPETTLFIAVSKSFKTPEISIIVEYFIDILKNKEIDYRNHFIVVSANKESYKIYNTHHENLITIPDTIGGRFSLWSATGLSISLFLGYEQFTELLSGAAEMDRHFLMQTPLKNIPVVLALLEFWYTTFFRSEFFTVNPYSERLKLLPMFLQQLQMESNGKSADIEGNRISYTTSSVVIGVTGTACQHSYFQALHQGKHFFHADLIGILRSPDFNKNKRNYTFLFSSMLAQAKTMINGYKSSPQEIVPEHKRIEGNKPCNLIFIKKWSPAALGNLLAMYEHKTTVLGNLWQINSFDQWGVERGKKICGLIEDFISAENKTTSLIDPATIKNIELFKSV